jgi:hypothetical protein
VKEPIMTRALIASTIVALCMVACAAEESNSLNGGGPSGENPGEPGGGTSGTGGATGATGTGASGGSTTPPVPGACEGLTHVGFAGTDFVADRLPGEVGTNRRRVKPYSALATEFARALGQVPAELAANKATFGEPPARWYTEPTEGAVSLYTTYTLAFTTCYDTMTGANYAAAPTATSATTECAAMQRKFWQRTPSPDETAACADMTLASTAETNARRRWAHACASILSSSGFTTY